MIDVTWRLPRRVIHKCELWQPRQFNLLHVVKFIRDEHVEKNTIKNGQLLSNKWLSRGQLATTTSTPTKELFFIYDDALCQ